MSKQHIEEMIKTQDARSIGHLQVAIRTARDAADNAERALARYAGKTPDAAARAVLHALTWGLANASSSIETAMSCIEDSHTMRATKD